MDLKTKLSILFIFSSMVIYTVYLTLDPAYPSEDQPLPNKTNENLFNNISPYIENAQNALCTKRVISTAMYTDGNYSNYQIIIKIPPDDPYMTKAWSQGHASIAFESRLQKTTEWIDNNEYKVTVYYYSNNKKDQPTILLQKQWVGCDDRVSFVQSLPKSTKGGSIYIKYESVLGSFFFFPNGNDVRFFDNYLAVE